MTTSRAPLHTGGCQCGAVRYVMYAEPKAGLCHCRMCQKATGAPFWAWAMVDIADFAWTGQQPDWFRSSSAARRSFCHRCGTPLGFRYDRNPDHMDVGIATLDDPGSVRPAFALGIESRLPWCNASLFDLPGHQTGALGSPEDLSKITIHQHPDSAGSLNRRVMPVPVIIDCDPGTDDAFALLLAFASPELDVLAVTVSGGNIPLAGTVRNALALRRLAGAIVPVFAGAKRPLLGQFHGGPDGLAGMLPAPSDAANPEIAADAIRGLLRTARDPVTLVGIGPATNFALALRTEPPIAARIARFVLMAGAWGEGNMTPSAEFNAASDPEALQIVLSSGRPVVMATLELTAQAIATRARIDRLRAAGVGRCLQTLCDVQAHIPSSPRFDGDGVALEDPCAVAWLIAPSLFSTRDCAVAVDLGPGPSRGRTLIDRWHHSREPASVTVLERLNTGGFFELLAQRLSRLP